MEPLEILLGVLGVLVAGYLAARFETIWYKMGKLEGRVDRLAGEITEVLDHERARRGREGDHMETSGGDDSD